MYNTRILNTNIWESPLRIVGKIHLKRLLVNDYQGMFRNHMNNEKMLTILNIEMLYPYLKQGLIGSCQEE